jgi:hypothetical protein
MKAPCPTRQAQDEAVEKIPFIFPTRLAYDLEGIGAEARKCRNTEATHMGKISIRCDRKKGILKPFHCHTL